MSQFLQDPPPALGAHEQGSASDIDPPIYRAASPPPPSFQSTPPCSLLGDHAESLDSVPEAQKLKEKPPGKNDSKSIRKEPVHAQLVLPEKKRLEDVVEEPVSLYTQPTPLRRKRWSIPSLR